MRLPFGIIHHSIRLTDLDAGKNLRVTGKKNTKAAPKRLCLCILFSCPYSCHLLLGVFHVFSGWWLTLEKHCSVSHFLFSILSFYNFFHNRLSAGKRRGVWSVCRSEGIFRFLRRCKFKPCGFCKKSPRLCYASGCILSQKICQQRNTNLLLAPETR